MVGCEAYRVPTGTGWEGAARGGTDQPYPGAEGPEWVAWARESAGETPHAVGQLRANACGLVDMGGNVAEWVHDRYTNERPGGSDPLGDPTASDRVSRGGAWVSDPTETRVPARKRRTPTQSTSATGYRMARTAD